MWKSMTQERSAALDIYFMNSEQNRPWLPRVFWGVNKLVYIANIFYNWSYLYHHHGFCSVVVITFGSDVQISE